VSGAAGTGSATTIASTRGSIFGNVESTASRPVLAGGTTTVRSEARFAGPGPVLATGLNAFAVADALPDSTFVGAAFATNTKVATAFGAAGTTVLGAGALGATSPIGDGTGHYTSSIAWRFDTTGLSGNLLLGFLDDAVFGADFASLQFSIVKDGTLFLDQLFTDATVAQAFFDDEVLDLGTFSPDPDFDLVLDFDLLGSTAGSGFAEDFVFGAVADVVIAPPTAVPEPGTLTLLGFGTAAIVLVRRRRRAAA
jgi:hypothetical protein